MTPLQTLLHSTQMLAAKPFHLFSQQEQIDGKQTLSKTFQQMLEALKKSGSEKTMVFRVVFKMDQLATAPSFDEVLFLKGILHLIKIYRETPNPKNTKTLDQLEAAAGKARHRAIEYQTATKHIIKRAEKLSPEEQQKKDLETLQKVGIFYVLEYTLQVQFEFTRLNEAEKQQLLEKGLKTPAGNLPAYYPLEDTFRTEFCSSLFDQSLRDESLKTFYEFEDVLNTHDIKKIGTALKIFNKQLLTLFHKKGLAQYNAAVYAPYGNHVSILELLKKI